MTTINQGDIPDLSSLTCTNLMVRLKIMLKKRQAGSAIEFIIHRNQRDAIDGPFCTAGYDVKTCLIGPDHIHVTMTKHEKPYAS